MNVWLFLVIAIVVVTAFILGLTLLFNAGMMYAAAKYSSDTIDKQLKLMAKELPGTDCGQCGCESCMAYAHAVFTCHKEADLCVPGGEKVAKKLKAHMEDFDKILNAEKEREEADWMKQMENDPDWLSKIQQK